MKAIPRPGVRACLPLLAACLSALHLQAQNAPPPPPNPLEQVFRLFEGIDRARRGPQQQQVRPALPAAGDARVQSYRQQMDSFANGSGTLTQQLERAMGDRAARTLLPDAYQVRSLSWQLADQAATLTRLSSTVTEDYRALDTAWRALSHRLRLTPGLDAGITRIARTLDGTNDALCQLLSLQAVFEKGGAMRIAAEAAACIDVLSDDIQYELRDQASVRSLVHEGHRVRDQMRQFAAAVDGYNQATFSQRLQDAATEWQQFSTKIHTLRNPRLTRGVMRTQERYDQLYDLVRLDRPMHGSYLASLAQAAATGAGEIFARHDPQLAAALGRAHRECLTTARTLPARLDEFALLAREQRDRTILARSFRPLADGWSEFHHHAGEIDSPSLESRCANVDGYVREICQRLGITTVLASREQLVAETTAANQFGVDLRQDIKTLLSSIPDPNLRKEFDTASLEFARPMTELMREAARGSAQEKLLAQFYKMTDAWRRLAPLIDSMHRIAPGDRRFHAVQRRRPQGDAVIARLAVLIAP